MNIAALRDLLCQCPEDAEVYLFDHMPVTTVEITRDISKDPNEIRVVLRSYDG